MKVSRRNTEKQGIISDWIAEKSNPNTVLLVQKNMAIADRIKNILDTKGLKAIELAEMLGKDKSEISKWLTGLHNFTTKTIVKIEAALGEEIIHIEPKERVVYLTAYIRETTLTDVNVPFEEVLAEYA
jgi:transcriptional regulator with XRE-family HTH domain